MNSLTFGFACSERADAAQRRAIENGDVITQIGFGAAKVSATATQTLATMGAGGYIAGTRAGVAATNALSKLPCAVKTTGQVGGIAIGGVGTYYSGQAAYEAAQEGDYANMISHGTNALAGAIFTAQSAKNFGRSCFTEGTQVVVGMEQIEDEYGNLTTVYTTANIEDIQVGDLVLSYDLLTQEWASMPVVRTFEHDYVGGIVTLEINGELIEATGNHPFWVVSGDDLESRPMVNLVDDHGMTPNGR